MDDLTDTRTFRVPVKLVNAVDQSELPIEGFVLIPSVGFQQLETVARSARCLFDAIAKASTDANQIFAADKARGKLRTDLDALALLWDSSVKSASGT